MNAARVPWSHASFLVYLGGITILAAMLAFLSVESGQNGAAGLVGWSALVLGVLATLAFLARRNRRFVTAGLYALSAVAAFVGFFGALLDWFGWLPDPHGGLFAGFRFWLLVLELPVVVAAWGLLQVTTHFAERWAEVHFLAFFPLGVIFFPFLGFTTSETSHQHMWAAPLAYAALGLVFIVIAQLLARLHREAIPAAELL